MHILITLWEDVLKTLCMDEVFKVRQDFLRRAGVRNLLFQG
jgi:hypothetical protein